MYSLSLSLSLSLTHTHTHTHTHTPGEISVNGKSAEEGEELRAMRETIGMRENIGAHGAAPRPPPPSGPVRGRPDAEAAQSEHADEMENRAGEISH